MSPYPGPGSNARPTTSIILKAYQPDYARDAAMLNENELAEQSVKYYSPPPPREILCFPSDNDSFVVSKTSCNDLHDFCVNCVNFVDIRCTRCIISCYRVGQKSVIFFIIRI